jgi:hypothetical protein
MSKDGTIRISRRLLAGLIDRFEARIPQPTGPIANRSTGQREVDERIREDNALVDEARHVLRPSFQGSVDALAASHTLEELRFARDVAQQQGHALKAFALATAIDRKRGLY